MTTTVEKEKQKEKNAPDSATSTFQIGTRRSILARVQTDQVIKLLQAVSPHHVFVVQAMATTGDNNQSTALHKFAEKSLWTQELEVLLLNRSLDFIVHSLKDMPTQLPMDLELGCVTARHDPRDALVVKSALRDRFHDLTHLPEGSVVGTSSLRRIAQLKRHHPHLRFADIRGNIGTRLAKLDDPHSEYHAIVLAAAGLQRLGMLERVSSFLTKDSGGMLHAVGQGALGIESRVGDERVQELLRGIGCEKTTRQVLAERSLMRTLEGGCSVPIGVETEWVSSTTPLAQGSGIGIRPAAEYDVVSGLARPSSPADTSAKTSGPSSQTSSDELIMRAIVVSLDGTEAAEVETRKMISSREDADEFGRDVARILVERGADTILQNIRLNRGIIQDQGGA